MAKKGFPSKEAAEEAIRQLGKYSAYRIRYRHTNPVTGEKKWFIRELPRNQRDKGPRWEGKGD